MMLPARLEKLQAQKAEILRQVESWPSHSIYYKPSLQEWSTIEVIDHLVRTEVEILAAVRKGLLKPHRIGVTDVLRTRFIQAIFNSDRKVKAPAKVTQILPGSNLELSEIVQRWNNSRRELSDLLDATAETTLSKGVFKHPVAGWMGMPQVLDFFSVHIIHHEYQLARLKNITTQTS